MRIKDLDRNQQVELEMHISRLIQMKENYNRAEFDLMYCKGEIDRIHKAIEAIFEGNTNKETKDRV